MDKLLVSACLLGAPCRYDGKSKPLAGIERLREMYELVPVCPEQEGGLPTPRTPSERRGEAVRKPRWRSAGARAAPPPCSRSALPPAAAARSTTARSRTRSFPATA